MLYANNRLYILLSKTPGYFPLDEGERPSREVCKRTEIPRKAIEYHEQAMKIAREIGDKRNEGHWLGNLGSAYGNLGDPKKAIEFLKQSLDIGKAIEDPRIIRLCERKLEKLESVED